MPHLAVQDGLGKCITPNFHKVANIEDQEKVELVNQLWSVKLAFNIEKKSDYVFKF